MEDDHALDIRERLPPLETEAELRLRSYAEWLRYLREDEQATYDRIVAQKRELEAWLERRATERAQEKGKTT